MKTTDVRTIQATNLTVKRDLGNGTRQLSGYAVTFNQPSNPLPFIEYIRPGAFDNVDMSQVRLLYAHDYNNILARVDSGTLSLKVDDKGLFFVANIPDTTLGNDVYANVQNGNIKGLSFNAVIDPNGGDTWSQDDHGNVIHTITQFKQLNEISLTPIPAYTETSVQVKRDYKEVLKSMNKNDSTAPTSASSATSTATSAANSASSSASATNDDILAALKQLTNVVKAAAPASNAKRDDDQGSDATPDSDDVDRSTTPANPGDPTSSAAKSAAGTSSNPGDPKSSASSSSSTTREAQPASGDDVTRDAVPAANDNQENGDEKPMSIKLNDNKNQVIRDFGEYLKTGVVADSIRRDDNNVKLNDGSVLIPDTILAPEHEEHQFSRLGNLVRTVSVKTTTGKLPVFQTSDDTLSQHNEFEPTQRHKVPEITPINWDLKTYTANYAVSQDLLSDSTYPWISELQGRLKELEDNTNDQQIITQLTNGVTAATATDLISDIKTALNVNLKPQDSQAASIVLSQSAFNQLDQMTDKMGRPLVQPDVTKSTGSMIVGKSVVVVDDTLFPAAKNGDVNIIVAPLQKAIINFKNNEITGKLIDTYDVWYQLLSIYLRQDVVQARKDLITFITGSKTTAKAAGEGTGITK